MRKTGFSTPKSSPRSANLNRLAGKAIAERRIIEMQRDGRNQVCNYEELVEAGQLERKALHTEAEFF